MYKPIHHPRGEDEKGHVDVDEKGWRKTYIHIHI